MREEMTMGHPVPRALRVLVTGATGVIGRRVVPMLLAAGHQVTALARTSEKRAAFEVMGVRGLDFDLLDPASVRAAVSDHAVVINLATHLPPPGLRMFLPGAWRENDRIRRFGSANLVDAALAAGADRLIQESFAPTYPDRGDAWITEETAIAPARYNRTVIQAEEAAARFTRQGGAGVVLRFGLFYGPDAAHVHDLIRSVRRGWAPLPGPPGGFLSSVSHDDAAAAVIAALRLPAGVYNVVDDEPLTRRQFVDALAEALGVPPPRLPPPWTAHLMGSLGQTLARSLRISNRKLRQESTWTPAHPSLREGWRATVEQIARAEPAPTSPAGRRTPHTRRPAS
jgi:nucleoside-diphosphate-sugar epimerase